MSEHGLRLAAKHIGSFWWLMLVIWFIVNALRVGWLVPIPLNVYAIIDVLFVELMLLSRVKVT